MSCYITYEKLPLEGSRPPPLQINETNIWYNVALNLTMGTLFPLTSVANNVSELLLRIVFGNKEGNSTDWSDENAAPSPLFENGIVNLLFYDLLIPVAYGLGWFVAVLLLTLIYCACASRKKADALKKSPIIALNAILLLLVMAMSAAMITLAFFAVTGDLLFNYSLKTNKQLYQLAAKETNHALQMFQWCHRRKRSVTLPEETEFYDNCKVAMKYIEAHIEEFKTECMPVCNTECRMILNRWRLYFKLFSSSNCDEYFSSNDANSVQQLIKTCDTRDQTRALDKIGHQVVKFGDSLRDRIQYFLKILSPYLIFARYISILVLYWLLGISLLYCLGAILMTKRIFQKGVASTAKFKIFRSGASCATATSFLIACYLCFWIAVGGFVYISCENAKNVAERSGLNVITHDDIERIDLIRLANEAIYIKRAKDEPLNGEDFHLFKSRFRRYAGNSKSVSRVLESCKAGKTLYSALGIEGSTVYRALNNVLGVRYVRSRRQSNGSAHGNSVEKNHTLDALEKLILQSSVENESCTSLKSRIIGFVKLLHNFMLKAKSGKVLVKRQMQRKLNMLYNHVNRFSEKLQNEVLECDSLLYQLQTFHKAICVDIAIPFNMYWVVVVMWTILAYFAAYLALIIEYSYGENYGKPLDDIESSKVSNKGESTAEGKSEAEKSAVSKVTSQSEIKDAAQSSVSKAIDQSRKDMSRYDRGERTFGDFSAISRRTAHVRKRLSSYATEAAGRMRDRYDRVRRRRHRSDRYDESVGEPRRRRWRDRIDFRRRRRMDVSEMTRTYDDGPSRGSRDRCDESEMTRARESEDSRRHDRRHERDDSEISRAPERRRRRRYWPRRRSHSYSERDDDSYRPRRRRRY
ncbi:Phosphatidylserine synthase [Trichinella spiralis]|uniref:Phosphatidylserine synthase n=1 Tax=Trichinella spiralis TaxID=6334 RepID=A0ABR3KN16_TRISP